MDEYKISFPFAHLNCEYNKEITISSKKLVYSEIIDLYSGIQCNNMKNEKEIHDKCKQIADLIREIEELNR